MATTAATTMLIIVNAKGCRPYLAKLGTYRNRERLTVQELSTLSGIEASKPRWRYVSSGEIPTVRAGWYVVVEVFCTSQDSFTRLKNNLRYARRRFEEKRAPDGSQPKRRTRRKPRRARPSAHRSPRPRHAQEVYA